MKSTRIKALIGAGALSLAFLGGIALAPSLSSSAAAQAGPQTNDVTELRGPGADLFSVAAQFIGITVDELRTEMGTDKSMADVAVAHGKDRVGLVAALTAAEQLGIAQRIGVLVDHKGFPQGPKFGGEGRHGFGPGGPALGVRVDPFQAAATYLGISTADLQTKMRSGQTLAQIATATPNKTRDGLIKAIVDDQTAKIDQAVKDNTITADMATKIETGLQDRVTRLVDHTGPAGGSFVPRGPHL